MALSEWLHESGGNYLDTHREELGRSLLFYPLVGLLIGTLLTTLAMAISAAGISDLLGAALVLAAWVALTGGLHLDGLADSADA